MAELELKSVSDSNLRPYEYKLRYYQGHTCLQKYSYMLIRPPRLIYSQDILNPVRRYGDKFTHEVFDIPFPLSLYTVTNMKYVLLYLHGNSSGRFEGYLKLSSLPDQVGLACFDFNGCGLRMEGQYISLGKHQSKEVDIAVAFLQQKGHVVVGWGRSMGAVSLLLSQKCNTMIVDSPFSSLRQVCKEIASTQCPTLCLCFFHCLFPCFFCLVARDVEKKTSMHPSEMEIIEVVRKMKPNRSLMLIAGENDSMISHQHSRKLYDAFPGTNKKITIFDGTHNSNRPFEVIYSCFDFIRTAIKIEVDGPRQVVRDLSTMIKTKNIVPLNHKMAPDPDSHLNLGSNIQSSNIAVLSSKIQDEVWQ